MSLRAIAEALLGKLNQPARTAVQHRQTDLPGAQGARASTRQRILCRWFSRASPFTDWATFYDEESSMPENHPLPAAVLLLDEEGLLIGPAT